MWSPCSLPPPSYEAYPHLDPKLSEFIGLAGLTFWWLAKPASAGSSKLFGSQWLDLNKPEVHVIGPVQFRPSPHQEKEMPSEFLLVDIYAKSTDGHHNGELDLHQPLE